MLWHMHTADPVNAGEVQITQMDPCCLSQAQEANSASTAAAARTAAGQTHNGQIKVAKPSNWSGTVFACQGMFGRCVVSCAKFACEQHTP